MFSTEEYSFAYGVEEDILHDYLGGVKTEQMKNPRFKWYIYRN